MKTSSWLKLSLGLLLAGGAVKSAQAASKFKQAKGKIKPYFTNWRVVRISQGFVVMEFNYKVLNNLAYDITVNNLYVTIQAMVGGQFKDVMVSGKIDNKVTLPAQRTKDIPPITLLFNVQDVGSLISAFSQSGQAKVITTFNYLGFEISSEQVINTGDMVKNLQNAALPVLNKIGIQL